MRRYFLYLVIFFFFFFKQKTAYEMLRSLVGSEMCIRDSATTDWRKYSYAAGAFVGGLLCVEMFIHMTHAHSHEPPTLYPFRRIRNKAFPWGDGQSSLFGAEIDHTEE
eukprot:TRINITY_DN6365_c0_g1_i5.p2 TRINITY_DN6365_c0_g1~~TRINITY_DN6365_c0_g1_i5.p2  ORF type:complete len:108 (-),score=43.21 TRINITY_DN6365_c0_g1_i5:360-683(-)